jgi:hypothetical protein
MMTSILRCGEEIVDGCVGAHPAVVAFPNSHVTPAIFSSTYGGDAISRKSCPSLFCRA